MEHIKFIETTTAKFFNITSTNNSEENGVEAIREFIETKEVNIVVATKHGNQIYYQHYIPNDDQKSIVYYKIPDQSHSNQQSRNNNGGISIGMMTLEGGLMKSIYNSIAHVFSLNVGQNLQYTPEIEKLLLSLYTNLGTSLGLPKSAISTIQDEVQYWKQTLNELTTIKEKEKAIIFAQQFEKLCEEMRLVDGISISTIDEFIDKAHNMLDELWRLPQNYPQIRMTDIMDILCSDIINACVENLNSIDIWCMNSASVSQMLSEVDNTMNIWSQSCDSLTRLFWPNYTQHTWIGEPHIPKQAVVFQHRIREILFLREIYQQMSDVIGQKPSELLCDGIYSPFKDITVFDTSTFGIKRWEKALSRVEVQFRQMDDRVALILKSELNQQIHNPRQVVHLFTKYNTVMSRPSIMELLKSEREHLIQAMGALVKDLKDLIFDGNRNEFLNSDRESISHTCLEIRWLKVIEHQITEIEKVVHFVQDRDSYKIVLSSLNELKNEIEVLLKTNFDLWQEEAMKSIKVGDFILHDDKPVVQFNSGDQLMLVTFKPNLITFCRDVRELMSLRYRIPIEMRDIVTHANRFMDHARRLQQIANFHNTIGDRMIACQRPIMLKAAIELSKLVQSESVQWNDEASVQHYISKLQEAVNNLSMDNSFLFGIHEQILNIVLKLMNTDLVQKSQIWKDEMKNVRQIIVNLETKGYTNLNSFLLHWDYQLYKVLEYQYLYGLLDMNNKLPTINIDIVFRQQQLQFRPTMEEIRSKYYSQLRRFLERPIHFHGLSDRSNNLFRVIVDRNQNHFGTLYRRAIQLFDELERSKDLWIPWVALGCVDLDELCGVHLKVWEDWDRNFKSCKYFSQQIAKIQNTENRIDCFTINLSPLRSDIEFISRKYWETLANTLRISILRDVSTLQDFLQTSLQVLQNIPLDEYGIAEAGGKYERIVSNLPAMADLLQSVESKDTCLAGWCTERVTALVSIRVQWEQLEPLIEDHSSVLQRQIDLMRNHITTRVRDIRDEAERFLIRWQATILQLENNENKCMLSFKERQIDWQSIKTNHEQLKTDCTTYNIEFPDEINHLFANIETELKSKNDQWIFYDEFLNDFDKVLQEEWAIYRRRPYLFTDVINKWSLSITDVSPSSTRIKQHLDDYKAILPALQALQSDALTDKHWAQVLGLLGSSPKPLHAIQLSDVIDHMDILKDNIKEVQNLVRKATSEQIVRQALTEIDQWGVTAVLKLGNTADSKGNFVPIIHDIQDVLNKIGDNQCLLQSARNSPAIEAFIDQVEIWENRLSMMDHILTSLIQVQRKWIYLEPIFGGGTIRAEIAIFQRIDKDFRYIGKEISNDPRLLTLIKIKNIKNNINSLETQLARCQNTLNTYIMERRKAFPRFYFLSDDDLLEIIGQATVKVDVMQKHIGKIIPGIHNLIITISAGQLDISGIRSAEGDELCFNQTIRLPVGSPVENVMNLLISEIQSELKEMIIKCGQTDDITMNHIRMYPVQVLCTCKALSFTKQTEVAITQMRLKEHLTNIKFGIDHYTSHYLTISDKLFQIKVRSLLIDMVHYASIVEELIRKNVTTINDWDWIQQLRFYLGANQAVVIKQIFAEFQYSYEYLGNPSHLVNTTLTHNCYLTLTQSMILGMGANPFGPAGTGKTECVKSLGAMFGRLVLVFNCNENVDTIAMRLILEGLAQSGAWGCFDEFNRLTEITLSSIATYIQTLQLAIKQKQKVVTFHRSDVTPNSIPLNLNCAMFVTMNPAGEDYGGRHKLPANLQALFRPIVMRQPEPKEIAKVMLFVEGFQSAESIGNRMVEIFELSNKILSRQRHYEWGLRELKTVLLASGTLLRDKRLSQDTISNETEEMEVAIMGLRSNIMSKLTKTDCVRFDMLISSVFPKIQIRSTDYITLKEEIDKAFNTLGLLSNKMQADKCIQLYEQLEKRIGVVILGPPKSGKTTVMSVLRQALSSMEKTIHTYTISPKSMSRVQLLGKLDQDTRKWHDGVLTMTAVTIASEPSDVTSWVICDGDIDPEWIEALNSVLDDNRLLTLPSGWRIKIRDNVNFLFETHDLHNASPATISRMGIINISADDIDQSILVNSWLQKQSNGEILRDWIDDYLNRSITFMFDIYKIDLPQTSIVNNVLHYLSNNTTCKEEFLINLLRGIGSGFPSKYIKIFSEKLCEWANIYVSGAYDLIYFNSHKESIEVYDTDLTSENYGSEVPVDNNSLIKTATMKVYSEIIRNFLSSPNHVPFLIIGPSGSGKKLLLQNMIAEFTGFQIITINCSAQLSTNYILYILKQNCIIFSSVRGKEYKPKCERLILYLINVNLCRADKWGTSDVIELLIQLISRNGFYDEDTLEWISLSGIQITGSISISNDNSNEHNLSNRFLANMLQLRMEYPLSDDMQTIVRYQMQYLGGCIKIEQKIDEMADVIIRVYTEVQRVFGNANEYVHYKFNPKMITKLINGLKVYPETCFQMAFFNEFNYVFRNRLTNVQNRLAFDEILNSTAEKLVQDNHTKQFFVPTRSMSAELMPLLYDVWVDIVQRNITICNTEGANIKMPISENLLEQTAWVCRALAASETNLTLCGRIGSGRKESLYIACAYLQINIVHLQPLQIYKLAEFNNDLKQAIQIAATDNKYVVLLIDHAWILYEKEIMTSIEALLGGSEIPDLFGDDFETIMSSLRNSAIQEGYSESMQSYFWRRIQSNLRIVLTLESSNITSLNALFLEHPIIYRKTDIIWYLDQMADEGRKDLPVKIIQMASQSKENISIPSFCEIIPKQLTDWELSYRRYQQLIQCYYFLHTNLKNRNLSKQTILRGGIEKLTSAHAVVDILKSDSKLQEIALAEKRQLANNALEMISTTIRNANDQKTDLLELKQKAQESSENLSSRKKAIERELEEVQPILDEAQAAVGQIKPESLSEIRSLRAPPDTVRDILEGVLRLMGIRDTSWNSMKTFLSKRGVKEDIRAFDPANISVENCNAVAKLIQAKAVSFEPKTAKRASVAAVPLAAWVVANVKYAKVAQRIKPLELEQRMLEESLNATKGEILSLKSGMDDVDARVKSLSEQLNIYTQEAAQLQIKYDEAKNMLAHASILVEKLSAEFETWSNQLEQLNSDLKVLDPISYLISLCITHLSHLTFDKRSEIVLSIEKNLQFSEFQLSAYLYTDQDKILWESHGLTPDNQSMENASLLIKILDLPFGSCPTPLIIDTSGSASKWLQNYLNEQSIPYECVSQSVDRFIYLLELAVRFGKIFIVTDLKYFNPPIISLITTVIHSRFNKRLLQVGSKLVDFHDNFRLVLMSNFKFSLNTAVSAYVTEIPFTVTRNGLSDQLISAAIQLKRPELEVQRVQLLLNEGKLLTERDHLQEKLLDVLSSADGDILKNEKLLNALNEIKESTSSIEKSIKESSNIRMAMKVEYDQYRDFCAGAAKFYVNINHFYGLSSVVFRSLFRKSMNGEEDFNEKLMYKQLIRLVYSLLARGIEKSNHLMLGLLIIKNAFPDLVPHKEWESFITNFVSPEHLNVTSEKVPTWLNKEIVPKMLSLQYNHPNLYSKLQLDNASLWQPYVDREDGAVIPSSIKLSDFESCLVCEILRPDQLLVTLTKMTTKLLGVSNLSISKPNIKQLADESSPHNPIYIIAAGDIDPSIDIREYVHNIGWQDKYNEISIGVDQEKVSIQLLKTASEKGHWLCLKNCHLSSKILIALEIEISTFDPHKDFRLWLIGETTIGLSESFSLRCIKILYELPVGVKYKILRSINQWPSLILEQPTAKTVRLYCLLLFCNAVLQERKSYIPYGWSKLYEFNDSDLRVSIEILNYILQHSHNKIDWNILRGLLKRICYGGRIDMLADINILDEHLHEFFNEAVLGLHWKALGFDIAMPHTNSIQAYQVAFGKLNDFDEPSHFLLTRISTRARDLKCCRELLKKLRSIHFLTEDLEIGYEKRLKPIVNLWKKISENFDFPTSSYSSSSNPWQLFILSELDASEALHKLIQTTLLDLQKDARESSSSINLRQNKDLANICENQVPKSWKNIWAGPILLTDYLKAVILRCREAKRRFDNEMDIEFTEQIDFASIFSVEFYIAILKLLIARKLEISTCELMLKTSLADNLDEIHSFYKSRCSSVLIDGGVLKNNILVQSTESLSSSIEFEIPELNLTYSRESEGRILSNRHILKLPLYSNMTRDQQICTIRVMTAANSREQIILSGAALILPNFRRQ